MSDGSPVGGLARLEVAIERKAWRNAAGAADDVLCGLRFSLARGEVGAIVGPSGCGKTTLLRVLAGLDADYTGCVALPDHGAVGLPTGAGKERAVGLPNGVQQQSRLAMVFQEPRLLPWRTVEMNVRLAAPAASDALLDQLFSSLGLAEHRGHFPGELSLGLARRVAIVRAFAVEPDVLLLDEPFVSLDAALAARLRRELADLVDSRPMGRPNSRQVTTLLVTHDIDEAIELADRIVLLSERPARVVGEVAIAEPRGQRPPLVVADVRRRLAAL